MNEDPDLMEKFACLRRAEVTSAPSFERVISTAGRRSTNAGWRVAVAACILVVGVGWVILRVPHPPPGAPTIRTSAPTLADWRAPTDFLLDTPAAELLHTIPDLEPHTPKGLDSLPPIGLWTTASRAGMEQS
jgi:hypothetical protein